MKKIKLIFDIDGTICPIKSYGENYSDLIPNADMLKKMHEYKEKGVTIVLHTSRNMKTYNSNLGLINANTAKVLLAWLEKWDIPYDEIVYGKPWPGENGFYIDDRAIRPNEFLNYDYNVLTKICDKSAVKDNRMNMVITMAGLGSRFKKAGYKLPKYMIEVKGKTLFEWAMISLENFYDNKFLFIVLKSDNAVNFIEEQCKKIGINFLQIIEVDRLTKGQAETVMYSEKYWNIDEGLFIYNIDTYVEPGKMTPELITGDGFIPCFHANGEHWSFVKLDDNGNVVEVREKKRISDNCTIGAYFFKNCFLYKQIYSELYLEDDYLENNEQYIAPMYNKMVEHNMKVTIQNIESSFVHVLGTPQEVENFKSE